jgi:hypothetical protein
MPARPGHSDAREKFVIDANPRAIPRALLSELSNRLPVLLQESFGEIIVEPENDRAWKQTQLIFQDFTSAALERIDKNAKFIPQLADDAAATRKLIEGEFIRALEQGRIARAQEREARAQIETLTAELQRLQERATERQAEPGGTALSDLLKAGDLDGALRMKTEQVEARRGEVDKPARDLFELGTIHEPDAL